MDLLWHWTYDLYSVKNIKDIIVIKDKFTVLLIDKKVEETTAGIINRITNGLVIPPVKKTSVLNCIRS